ncbi:MAG: S23 ribosomal protein [Candidatus Saganbacteria bacterium]|uniref:S23 ribosomal protein n=1 Tax=Candidatus Saganbacteria bacterium TaxID=2575572 RepID=A0A833L0T0_UNCSA|nr:MAG: S23 ribosomal protein [Candidatus Saganbacteria bacterium]
MFTDFKDKEIYKKAKELYSLVNSCLKENIPKPLKDQISRSTISIILNFSEGYGRFTKNDKKHFYITARASLNETATCFDLILLHLNPGNETIEKFNALVEELSKMFSGLINSQK